MLRSVVLAVAAATVMFGGAAGAQEKWKLASGAQPGLLRDHHVAVANSLGTSTQGAVSAEFLFVGSEQEVVQQVVRGRLEIGVVSMIALAILRNADAVDVTGTRLYRGC